MSETDRKAVAQRLFVEENPMRDVGAAGVAHAEHVEGVQFREGSENKALSDARKMAILKVFSSLRSKLQSEKGIVGTDRALSRVARAFESWMKARKEDARGDSEAVMQSAKRLVVAVIVFLKKFA